MKEHQDRSINETEFDPSFQHNRDFENLLSLNNREEKNDSKIIQITNDGSIKRNSEMFSGNAIEIPITKETSDLFLQNNPGIPEAKYQSTSDHLVATSPFRLFVKNGEYVYARPNDIIMIESCDHLVKVYLGVGGKVKLTIRHNTLKDFLLQLPQSQFKRLGRFCAVNIHRLSGGNSNEQIFEFDFTISLRLKHSVSHAVFAAIGK